MDEGIEGGIRRLLRDSKAFQVGPKQKGGGGGDLYDVCYLHVTML